MFSFDGRFKVLIGGVVTGLSEWLNGHQEHGNFPIFFP